MNFDQTLFTDVPSPSAVVPAVKAKFANFQGKTWNSLPNEREVSCTLATLPSDVSFPDTFPEPIQYDAVRKRLKYRGFMPHASFVELQKLSNDFNYLRTLEQLFSDSATPATTTAKPNGIIITSMVAIALIAAIAWFIFR
jgi:hypothetical protein